MTIKTPPAVAAGLASEAWTVERLLSESKGDWLMVTTLIDVVRDLQSLPGEATICAAKPWSETSRALIVAEADNWGMSPEAHSLGMAYFLEVFIAAIS
jgi:hypothetical protein